MVQPIVGDMHGLRLSEMDLEWKIVESRCPHTQDNKDKAPETSGPIVDSSGMVADRTFIPGESNDYRDGKCSSWFGGIVWRNLLASDLCESRSYCKLMKPKALLTA